jgi:hypothetical protein
LPSFYFIFFGFIQTLGYSSLFRVCSYSIDDDLPLPKVSA